MRKKDIVLGRRYVIQNRGSDGIVCGTKVVVAQVYRGRPTKYEPGGWIVDGNEWCVPTRDFISEAGEKDKGGAMSFTKSRDGYTPSVIQEAVKEAVRQSTGIIETIIRDGIAEMALDSALKSKFAAAAMEGFIAGVRDAASKRGSAASKRYACIMEARLGDGTPDLLDKDAEAMP